MTARKAVDPIIASLLLIAIAVAAGIIVYVYVNSLAGGLTQGGGQQVSDQIQMDAYNYGTIASGVVVTVRDVGSTTITIGQIFFDGQPIAASGTITPSNCAPTSTSSPASATISPTTTCSFTLAPSTAPSTGTSHTVKIITSSGGTSTMTVIAGRTG